MNHYHNTTEVSGATLNRFQNKALSQDERVLEYFMQAWSNGGDYVLLTPSQALKRVFPGEEVPITSVRRALSNLTRDGKLEKSGQARGPLGRPEYYWRLVEQSPQRRLL